MSDDTLKGHLLNAMQIIKSCERMNEVHVSDVRAIGQRVQAALRVVEKMSSDFDDLLVMIKQMK